jgi:catechol 2,3-dioxygenase-like lactoylglutathione lyase family enzyme
VQARELFGASYELLGQLRQRSPFATSIRPTLRGEATMLADARIDATVPTTDLDRAREFYGRTLGLRVSDEPARGRELVYECGGGTRLLVYERPSAGTAEHTLAHFVVGDLEGTVRELRERGVTFEEYDLPDIKTVEGIATFDDFRAAWFKDPDGNIIGLNSANPAA